MTDWNTAEEHVDRALELFRRGRLEEAEQSLRRALEIAPDRGDWQFNLALTLDAAGRIDEAVNWYLEAHKSLPEESEITVATGIALCKSGRLEEGLVHLEHGCKELPECEEAWAHRIDALARMNQHEEARNIYFLAQQYLDEYPNCLYAMGESLLECNEQKKAVWCFREALRQEPSLPRVRARLAAALAANGRSHRAIRMYLQELRENPGSAETLLEFGDLLMELGRLNEAEEKFRRVLEIKPAEIEAHRRLGDVMSRLGRFELAISEYELARSLDPEGSSVLLPLAKCLLALKRTREAQRTLLEHLEFHPDEATREDDLRFADLLITAGLPGVTRDHLSKALLRHPDDVQLLRRAAFACFDGGDRRGGDRISRKLRRMDQSNVTVQENLVLSALKAGQPGLASRRLKRALEESPDSESLRRLRAFLFVQWIPKIFNAIKSRLTRTHRRPQKFSAKLPDTKQ